jgi:hypothetical protein
MPAKQIQQTPGQPLRVSITTLWQIGYTVNHNVRVGQIRPNERYKEGAIFRRPERARISWGKPCEVGVRGRDLSCRARGRCHLDTFTCANSQSENVGQQDLSIYTDRSPSRLSLSLMGGKPSLLLRRRKASCCRIFYSGATVNEPQ